MDILVTAFTPFNGMSENMSARVMALLPKKVGENSIRTLLLPTSYERSIDVLTRFLEKNKADAVVMTGQAPRDTLTVERVAINVGDCSLGDNDGVVLRDTALIEGAPAAYFSALPIKAMCAAGGGRISNTAGTYVCNALMYKALHLLGKDIRCGFVHIPQSGEAQAWADGLTKMIEVL